MNDTQELTIAEERSPARQRASMLRAISAGLQALEGARTPKEALDAERKLDVIEQAMKATGLFKPDEVREANEGKIRARWKLGRLLREIERGAGPGRGKKVSVGLTSFRDLLRQIGLDRQTALESQRIGTMPEPKLEQSLARYRGTEDFITYGELLREAKTHWYVAKREEKHEEIKKKAKKAKREGQLGPFALLYFDPPWVFESWAPEHTNRTPDTHYPTLSDDEIVEVKFSGKTITELAAKDSIAIMWCTSANMKRAMAVLERLGFTYKTNAVWDKEVAGIGLVFRNQHEMLLYASRGSPPQPMFKPRSVFRFKRGKHSAKPPEIRKAIEKMFPKFGAAERVELFARGKIKGWTALGYEADE